MSNTLAKLFNIKFFTFEVLLKKGVIRFCDGFNQHLTATCHEIGHVRRDIPALKFLPSF